jgi:hypothetical protein
MLKKLAQTRTIRTCEAVLEYPGEKAGEIKKENVTVEYYSPTTAEQEAWFDHVKAVRDEDPLKIVWKADELFPRVHALTDSGGERLDRDNGELTIEWLKGLETPNLDAIDEAIRADIKGKSTSTK